MLFGMFFRWLGRVMFVVVLFGPHVAAAQSVVSGTVTDPQSAVVPDARVALMSGRSEVRTTRTDAQGRYRFEAVPPGTYSVVVSASGFQAATSTSVTLSAGQ